MNENIDLTQILKNCPKGWKFYSSIHGNVEFLTINNNYNHPIRFLFVDKYREGESGSVTKEGLYIDSYDGECTFFPSKDQRDWSKFTAPWLKKKRFDPKTLQSFDKVLIKYEDNDWLCSFFSKHKDVINSYPIRACVYCIPYNDDTKHLLGTKDEAPEFYRYWED